MVMASMSADSVAGDSMFAPVAVTLELLAYALTVLVMLFVDAATPIATAAPPPAPPAPASARPPAGHREYVRRIRRRELDGAASDVPLPVPMLLLEVRGYGVRHGVARAGARGEPPKPPPAPPAPATAAPMLTAVR